MDGFRKFILRGNVVDLAVGVIIGAAFGAIVTAFVTGIMNPIIGLAGKANFDKLYICIKGSCSLDKSGNITGHALLYGSFLTAAINFLIIAAAVYFGVVLPVGKMMDKYKTEPEAAAPTKECPECLSSIPEAAVRCAFCTVEQLEPV